MTDKSEGVWLARSIESGTNKKSQKSLGGFSHLPNNQRFDAAKREAEAWFLHLGKGGNTSAKTVQDACNNYVKHINETKGLAAAQDVQKRFNGYVLDHPGFAKTELSKLTPILIGDWRTRLATRPVTNGRRGRSRLNYEDDPTKPTRLRSASTLNRDMTPFRAALNLAVKEGWVTGDFAWKTKLAPIQSADNKRELYLDKLQRTQLKNAACEEIQPFLFGLATLPLRPGALAALQVKDFDARLSQLTIRIDKTGARKIRLPTATSAVLAGWCSGKMGTAPIFSRENGTPWNKDTWKGPIKAAVMLGGLPAAATAYTLRHSVITDLVHSGLDLLTVAQLAGTSVRMIEAHYGHLRSEIALPALEALSF